MFMECIDRRPLKVIDIPFETGDGDWFGKLRLRSQWEGCSDMNVNSEVS